MVQAISLVRLGSTQYRALMSLKCRALRAIHSKPNRCLFVGGGIFLKGINVLGCFLTGGFWFDGSSPGAFRGAFDRILSKIRVIFTLKTESHNWTNYQTKRGSFMQMSRLKSASTLQANMVLFQRQALQGRVLLKQSVTPVNTLKCLKSFRTITNSLA